MKVRFEINREQGLKWTGQECEGLKWIGIKPRAIQFPKYNIHTGGLQAVMQRRIPASNLRF
jgi:hypothetical protein